MGVAGAHEHCGIGEVVDRLRPDFPGLTISKIRFLEAEGLVAPRRAPSGYRRFTPADIERLRFVLTAQRDHYLPLRVIRRRLAEREPVPAPPPPAEAAPEPAPAPERAPAPVGEEPGCAGREELIERTGVEPERLAELEEYGLVGPCGGPYAADEVAVVRLAGALGRYGLRARHLRAAVAAADREVALIRQVVAPMAHRRGPEAHERARELAGEIAGLSTELHAALVRARLPRTLD
ncbi:MerR family transcriptional regulator [Allonocardiopsis opalescens]|uniref:transcriptional regulator FtsR n=1 Tax=Allonocardiopsis opalescens TaxID=1144618 RepID=UPI001FE97AA2|nr:MerR family transcriptional regulator [Allonocardiopsis opalescens]